jgi:hypothetical protein
MAVLRIPTLLFSFVLVFWMGRTSLLAEPVSPYQLKAAFLYNFIKFVEWPQTPTSPREPYVVAVLGKDPFGPNLDELFRGKTVNGRPVVIKRLVSGEPIAGCHVVFISSSERRRLAQILQQARATSALTVADMEGFAESGGIVEFVTEGNKIRFEINIEVARASGLKIHSTLLNLAKIVRTQ